MCLLKCSGVHTTGEGQEGERGKEGGETEKLLCAGLVEKNESFNFQSPGSRTQSGIDTAHHRRSAKALQPRIIQGTKENLVFVFLFFFFNMSKQGVK